MADVYDQIQDLDAEVLAVSVDDLRGAESIFGGIGIPFHVLYDPDTGVVKKYGVYDILPDSRRLAAPSTFIIDRNGIIRWKYVANRYTDRPSTDQVLAQLGLLEG